MKETKYAGTQTEKNLMAAFAGESEARNKYTYFASKAKKEGFEQIAQHISSAREAVARMLKSFSEDGLVELKRGAITLRDKNRLNRLK